MGKSLELMGLAAFNIFVAIILSTTFLANGGNASVSSLTEDNVSHFVNEVAAVSVGKKDGLDSYGITEYFMAHVADSGKFKSVIEYSLPDMQSNTRTLEMDKLNFISNVLQGMKAMKRHETAVTIDYIKIADNGQSAKVSTTNYERGIMPVDDGSGEERMMPVTGTSYCEQKLILSSKHVIQMAQADCSTNIDFQDAY